MGLYCRLSLSSLRSPLKTGTGMSPRCGIGWIADQMEEQFIVKS